MLGRFILHEANKITVILCFGPDLGRKDRLATESVCAVMKGCRGLGFIIKLHNAIKAEGPLGVKGSRVDVARWMASMQVIHPRKVTINGAEGALCYNARG